MPTIVNDLNWPRILANVGLIADGERLYQYDTTVLMQLGESERDQHAVVAAQAVVNLAVAFYVADTAGRRDFEEPFKSAIDALERLKSDVPSSEKKIRRLIADTHNNLAVRFDRVGEPDESRKANTRAYDLYEELLAERSEDAYYRESIARMQYNFGYLDRIAGKYQGAKQWYQKAIDSYARLRQQDNDNLHYRANRAECFRQLGLSLMYLPEPAHDEAEEAFQTARGKYDELSKAHPRIPGYRHKLGLTLADLAYFYEVAGRIKEADEAHFEANRVLNQLTLDFQQAPDYWHDLAQHFYRAHFHFFRTGAYTVAENQIRAAISVWEEYGRRFRPTQKDREYSASYYYALGSTASG